MTDFETEMAALTRELARDLVTVVKIAALEAVAEVLKGEPDAPPDEPAVTDVVAPEEAEIDDRISDGEEDSAPENDSLRSWSERSRSSVADRVLFLVRAKPGQRSQDIRKALGLERHELREVLELLLSNGKIVKAGSGGGTTYWPA